MYGYFKNELPLNDSESRELISIANKREEDYTAKTSLEKDTMWHIFEENVKKFPNK